MELQGIEKVKSDVYKAIDVERQRAMEKYDTHKENIKNSKSVPSILKELVEIYGNNAKQREIMTSILKDFLTARFFKNAEIVGGANSIKFKNGNYSIEFSTSRIYDVVISRNGPLRPPIQPLNVREDALNFYELWKDYKETGENYGKLLDAYSMMRRGKLSGLIFKMKTKIEDIDEFAMQQKRYIDNVNEKIEIWKQEVEEYNKEIEFFKNMIIEIEDDLFEFRSNGWYINHKNLYGPEKLEVEIQNLVKRLKERESS